MSTFLAKFAVSGAALGGLAVMLLSGADPAEARPKSCLETYRGCTNRCVGRYDDAIPCIQRTCDKQYRNCEAVGRRAGLAAATRPGVVAPIPQSPRKDSGRPWSYGGSAKQNGGFVPTGSIFRSAHGRR